MPRNGLGSYSLPEAPFVTGTTILPAAVNSDLSDIANALTFSISKDGQTTPTADLPMGNNNHTGVDPTSGTASRTEYVATAALQGGTILDAGETGGTSTVYTATLTPAITAYADKQCFRVKFNAACGADPTINFNSVGAKKIYRNVSGTALQLAANDVPQNYIGILRYDTALDSSSGGFWLINSPVVSPSAVGADQLGTSAITEPVNLTFATSVAGNALTIAVKTGAGSDPSTTSPVKIPFPSQTGGYDVLSVTAATSLVVSSGSTLGSSNGIATRYWLIGFNDAGTFRLGIVNTQLSTGVFPIMPDATYSSTAEGGAGGADSAGVIYTGTAVTTKAICILGYLEATEATAGAWATAPSKTVVFKNGMKRPGDRVQRRYSADTTIRSTTSATPVDSSSSIAITAVNAINRVVVTAYAATGHSAGGVDVIFQIRRDTTDITPGGLTRLSAIRPPGTADLYGIAMSVDDTGHSGGSITYRLYWWTASGTAYLGRSGGSAATTAPSVVWSVEEVMS